MILEYYFKSIDICDVGVIVDMILNKPLPIPIASLIGTECDILVIKEYIYILTQLIQLNNLFTLFYYIIMREEEEDINIIH